MSFSMDFVRSYIRDAPSLPESPENHIDPLRTMPRPSTSPTSRTSQDSPATQSSPPESLPAHDSRNREPRSQDEPHDTAMATNYDDHSHQHPAARYKFYKSERNKYRDRCTELEAMLEERDDRLEQLEQEARDHEKEAKKREKAVAGLMEEFERLRERERIRSEELSIAEMQHEETKRILKTKVEELEGMQVFEEMLKRLEQDARDRKKEAEEREKVAGRLMDEFKRLREQERIRSDELSIAEKRHEETKRLLKTKVEELEEMHVLTRKAAPSAPQSSTSSPWAPQAPSVPQSSSTESFTHQSSGRENSWEKPSGTANVIRPDNNNYQQPESPCPNHIKSEYIMSTDKCAKPKKPSSSTQSRDHEPGQDPCYYERELKKREKEVEELKVEVKKLQEQERRRSHELSLVEIQHEETKRYLKSKLDELNGTQAFTKEADQASVTDVIELVKALNAAILQAASLISDPQHLSSLAVTASEQDIQQATEDIRIKLGGEMADAVRTVKNLRKELHPEDPTAVQFVLQITMTRLCDRVINAWTPHPDADKYLAGTYEKIRANETQTIAGRWRALTRAQGGGAKDPAAILTHLINRLWLVLVAVGSKVPADKFRSNFEQYLTSIADHVIRIQTTAGESITSVDVMPHFHSPGTEFDDDSMEDLYSTKDGSKGPILGTIELGLRKKEKTADAKGKSEDRNIPLFKAKVVFASSLRE